MRRIDLIVIHCTASRPDQHLTLGMLDQMHKARGWKCCGYHYYITRDGPLHRRLLRGGPRREGPSCRHPDSRPKAHPPHAALFVEAGLSRC